jgi:hypothetical protein
MSRTFSNTADIPHRTQHPDRNRNVVILLRTARALPSAHTFHADDINQWPERTPKSREIRRPRTTPSAVTPKIAATTAPRGNNRPTIVRFSMTHTHHKGTPNQAPESTPLDRTDTPKPLCPLSATQYPPRASTRTLTACNTRLPEGRPTYKRAKL